MTRFALVLLIAALLPAVEGCQEAEDGVIDRNGTPPYLSSASVQPPVIDLRTIPPVNGSYPVSATVTVSASSTSDDPVSRVSASISAPAADSPLQEIVLRDDGIAPDVTSGDGRYSGRLAWTASKSDIGRFPVRFAAVNGKGLESNMLEAPLVVTRKNDPPVLSALTVPDTVVLPPGGSLAIAMTVAVSDPDGQDDIREVYFRSLDSSDPTRKFFLLDDGLASSGDRVRDDGIFTITVALVDNSPTIRRTYRFAFQAADVPGDTSATLLHRLTVR